LSGESERRRGNKNHFSYKKQKKIARAPGGLVKPRKSPKPF
jgi:hypothetical protein